MEGAFEQAAFGMLRGGTIPVQPAKPFPVLLVWKVPEAPVMNLGVPVGIFGVVGDLVGECSSDDALAMGPPEFHVLPVFEDWLVLKVAEV